MCFLSGGLLKSQGLSSASDVQYMQGILSSLSIGSGGLLDAGESGAVARFCLPLAAITAGEWVLDGSPRLRERPVGPLFDALRSLGARIFWINQPGYLPVKVVGGNLEGDRITLEASGSSQYASALAMIAPLLKNGLTIELKGDAVSLPYLDLTLAMLSSLGINAKRTGALVRIELGSYPSAVIDVEPDWSAAAFIYAAVALRPGSEILLPGLNAVSAQGDSIIAELFRPLGVETSQLSNGTFIRHYKPDSEADIDLDIKDTPDLFPALAVTAAMLHRRAIFRGIPHLKIKESDRISAVAGLLGQFGYEVTEGPDFLRISENAPVAFSPIIDPQNDHRLAMAFSLMSLRNDLMINNSGCVEKSWPGYWEALASLGFRISPA